MPKLLHLYPIYLQFIILHDIYNLYLYNYITFICMLVARDYVVLALQFQLEDVEMMIAI